MTKIVYFKGAVLKSITLFVLKGLLFASFEKKRSLLLEYNIKRHCETKHASQFTGIQGQLSRNKITQLKNSLAQHQSLLKSSTLQTDTAERAGYAVSGT
jgi:hypothetical protein